MCIFIDFLFFIFDKLRIAISDGLIVVVVLIRFIVSECIHKSFFFAYSMFMFFSFLRSINCFCLLYASSFFLSSVTINYKFWSGISMSLMIQFLKLRLSMSASYHLCYPSVLNSSSNLLSIIIWSLSRSSAAHFCQDSWSLPKSCSPHHHSYNSCVSISSLFHSSYPLNAFFMS